MIKTGLLNKDHLSSLKKAVDVYARRHKVTAQNISNVETTGYRSQDLKFEEMLNGAGSKVRGMTTHRNHLPIGSSDIGSTSPELQETETNFDNGTNNVDIDREMTNLATNDLSYRLATRMLSMRYSMLRGAIKGSMR
jgi:flagellar basal-body rod protein FlgB